MRRFDAGARDRALARARRLRWVAAFVAASASVAGTALARATFQGHSRKSVAVASRGAHGRTVKLAVTPLPRRAMPNDVPLPPRSSGAPAPTPAPQPAPTPASAPAPAPAPAPDPVVSGGS
jgi:hypothetical protein